MLFRSLIDECVANETDFGFVLATGDGAVHEIGTRASVLEVLEVLDDGRMNIVVEGGERFRLLELTSGRAFTTGLVEPVVDDDEPPADADVERAIEVFRELAETSDSEVDLPELDVSQLDFELAARVDFAVDSKQELLAMTSPKLRMQRLATLLETALEAVQLERTTRDRAARNGKVTPIEPRGL